MRGEHGPARAVRAAGGAVHRRAWSIFPTLFGLYIAFTDWNLSSADRPPVQRPRQCPRSCGPTRSTGTRSATWSSTCWPCSCEYAIAFGLALLLNAEIRARKFFRVAFLLPFMLSPGRGELDDRQVDAWNTASARSRRLRAGSAGTTRPSSPRPGSPRLTIMVMDAWSSIPFMMIMLLAGLQALPKEVLEAAKVDGANALAVASGRSPSR